jgi:hypothetical protein
MMQTNPNDGRNDAQADETRFAAYRKLIARLPITMRPSLNRQLAAWPSLFPFEQNQVGSFVRGLESFQPSALDALTQPLRALEVKMGVEHWSFSQAGDTMENASMLARSEFYADWRREVQRIFEAVNAAARDSAPPSPSPARLILIVLPETLPVDPLHEWKSWDNRAQILKIDGDARRVIEVLIQGQADQPAIPKLMNLQGSVEDSDLWFIDADARLNSLHDAAELPAVSSLSYEVLKPFRDQFLSEVNTMPKSIEAADQILASMRHRNWETWWPSQLASLARLRSFVVELFLSGNGALIFSNAFVQWAASEALRRARPRIIVARFGLRSKPKPFTGIAIFENQQRISALPDVDDPQGSATDALILARYIWLSALRYPEQERTCCLCISEYRNAVYLIPPAELTSPWSPNQPVAPEALSTWIGAQFRS